MWENADQDNSKYGHLLRSDRNQKVVLRRQSSNWSHIEDDVFQCFILEEVVKLSIYNDLTKDSTSAVNLFADDMSLFAVAHDPETISIYLSQEWTKMFQQAYQWKLLFYRETSKESQEIVFCS